MVIYRFRVITLWLFIVLESLHKMVVTTMWSTRTSMHKANIMFCFALFQSEEEDNLWKEADVLSVVVGKDDVTYSKSTALQV